jgi:hypothetical protein
MYLLALSVTLALLKKNVKIRAFNIPCHITTETCKYIGEI